MANLRGGFTLVEIIVTIAVMLVIFSFALGFNSKSFSRGSMESERDVLVSLLQKSRSEAMANIGQAPHGLYVASSSYVLFQGASYVARNESLDASYPRGGDIDISGSEEVVFSSLEATSSGATFDLKGSDRSASVVVNSEGAIFW